MTLGGSLIAGTKNIQGFFTYNGAIVSAHDIGSLTIKGSVVGNSTNAALIAAVGQAAPPAGSDVAIGTIKITGRVEYGLIEAGIFGEHTNADAQIGTVTVGGDWIASSLVAGTNAGVDGIYGTADDVKSAGGLLSNKDLVNVLSSIGSITINGTVIGTSITGDHFGFVAETVGTVTINGAAIPHVAGAHNDNILLATDIDGVFGDVRLREI